MSTGRANPFDAPGGGHIVPNTSLGWLGMRSSFEVQGVRIEVRTSHWSGREETRIDGQGVRSVRNLGWHSEQAHLIGGHQLRIVSRWYPLLPVQVHLDGEQVVDDLFPQLWPIKVALMAVLLPLLTVLVGSTAWDLLRLLSPS